MITMSCVASQWDIVFALPLSPFSEKVFPGGRKIREKDSYALLGSDSKGIYKILIAKQHGYGSGDRARPLKFNLSRAEI